MIKGLAERPKELRQKRNLSQKDVAKYLDLSPSIISGYETGERTPSAYAIKFLHAAGFILVYSIYFSIQIRSMGALQTQKYRLICFL